MSETAPFRAQQSQTSQNSGHTAAAGDEAQHAQTQQRAGRRLWNRGGRVVVGNDQVGIAREGAACETCITLVRGSERKFGGVGRISTESGPNCGVIGGARPCGCSIPSRRFSDRPGPEASQRGPQDATLPGITHLGDMFSPVQGIDEMSFQASIFKHINSSNASSAETRNPKPEIVKWSRETEPAVC